MQARPMFSCFDSFLIWISSYSSSCVVWRISVPLAWQAAATYEAHSGTSVSIRKVQNLFSASAYEEACQQARSGDNPVKHYWVCWDTTVFFTEYQQNDPPTSFGKEMAGWLYDDIYPGGPVSERQNLVYAVEKSQVPRKFYRCTHNSVINITPDIIYLLSLDLVFAGILETKKLEPNSANWDTAQCSEVLSQNIGISHISWNRSVQSWLE